MARSLRVSPEYIEKVKLALPYCGYPNQEALARESGLSLSTIKTFLSGKPVYCLNFEEICIKLELDWREIADKRPTNSDIPADNFSFITGSPILQPRHFFGRQQEVNRLFSGIKNGVLQHFAIIGKKQIGKTSLLNYFKSITTTSGQQLRPGQKSDYLHNPKNYKWIFVDFHDARMATIEGFCSYILKNLNVQLPSSCNLQNFTEVVNGSINQPTIILMDEIGVALQRRPEFNDDFWENLRFLAGNPQIKNNLGFIVASRIPPMELARSTGHTSPFFNMFNPRILGEFTEKEVLELIASSPIPFPDEDISWIIEKSHCMPLLVQIFCREKLFSLEDGKTDESWREEGLRQIEQSSYLLSK